MGIANIINNSTTTSGGEIVRELVNSSDGQGLHFDGSGYVSAGDTTVIDGASKLSVEVIAATTAADNGEMVAKCHDLTALRFYVNTSGQVVFRVNNGSSNGTATSSGTVNDGNPTHIVGVWDGSTVKIYINGNEDGSGDLVGGGVKDVADKLALGTQLSSSDSTANSFTGTLFRARLFNYAVDAKSLFENGASVDFSSQYGSQTNKISGAVDKNWGTNQADTGNDANDRATFNTNYVWNTNGAIIDISVVSNVLQFTTASANQGVYYPSILTGGKKYRVTIRTGTITGDSFKVMQYDGSSLNDIGTLVASTTNVFEFTADSTTNGNLLVYGTGTGTLQINAASVDNEVVAIGCVSDYQTQWANPTQSLTVQDASGNADGTCSASGVTQVQPVVQLNSTSARIGTTAATPADGEVLADKIKVGSSAVAPDAGQISAAKGRFNGSDYQIHLDAPSGDDWYIRNPDGMLRFHNSSPDKFSITSTGVVNISNLSASSDVQTDGSKNLITSSDKRLKNDIGELTAGLDIISNLQPHYFSWKSDESNTQQLGFYAQDVYEFLPEAAPREEVTNEDGTTDYKWGFNGRPIIAALVAAVKELKAKVETLENA